MSYHHLSMFDRARIQTLHSLGCSTRQIALQTGRHHSSIARELVRNTIETKYRAEEAQQSYEKHRRNSSPHGKQNQTILTSIEEKLRLTWSPEQIASTTMEGRVSFKTIYNWLYQGKLFLNETVLRHKGKRRCPPETRGKFIVGLTIGERPKEVEDCQTFGHWELDTVVSSRGKSKGCFATFIERKSRLYTALKMPDRSSAGHGQDTGTVDAS